MCFSKTLERGVAIRFGEMYDWASEQFRRRVITDYAHLPLPKMRDAEDKTRSTQ